MSGTDVKESWRTLTPETLRSIPLEIQRPGVCLCEDGEPPPPLGCEHAPQELTLADLEAVIRAYQDEAVDGVTIHLPFTPEIAALVAFAEAKPFDGLVTWKAPPSDERGGALEVMWDHL